MSSSDDIDQKKSSKHGKTKKKSGNTNKTIDTVSESLAQICTPLLQCENDTGKSKKKRSKGQKNKSVTPLLEKDWEKDGKSERENGVMIDKSQNLIRGEGILTNKNGKQPEKESRLLDVKKNDAPETSSTQEVIGAIESFATDDSPILEANIEALTKEENRKNPERKRRLIDTKDTNEPETIFPEKIIDNIECKMTDNRLKIFKSSDNIFLPTTDNEEKPKRKRRKRNDKKKYALGTSTAGKVIKGLVETINSSEIDSEKIDDFKSAIIKTVTFVTFKSDNKEKNHELEPLSCQEENKDTKLISNLVEAESNVFSGENSKMKINEQSGMDNNCLQIIVAKETTDQEQIKSHLIDSNYQTSVQEETSHDKTPTEKCIRPKKHCQKGKNTTTKQNEESQLFLSNDNEMLGIQPIMITDNSDKEKEVIIKKGSSEIYNNDSKQAVEIGDCTSSIIRERRKRNKKKVKKEVESESIKVEVSAILNTSEDYSKIELKSENSLSKQNEPNLHDETKKILHNFQDNCEISDKNSRHRKHKANESESLISIKTDLCTDHSQPHDNISPSIEKSDGSADFSTTVRQTQSEIPQTIRATQSKVPENVQETQSGSEGIEKNNGINLEAASLILENAPIIINETGTLSNDYSKNKKTDKNNGAMAREFRVDGEFTLGDENKSSFEESNATQISVENSKQVQNKCKKSKLKNKKHMPRATYVEQSDFKSNEESINQNVLKVDYGIKDNILNTEKTQSLFAESSSEVDKLHHKLISTESTEKDHGNEGKFETKTKNLVPIDIASVSQPNEMNGYLGSQNTLRTNEEVFDKIELATPKISSAVIEDNIKFDGSNHKQTPVDILEQGQIKPKKKSKNKQSVQKTLIQQPEHETDENPVHLIGSELNKKAIKFNKSDHNQIPHQKLERDHSMNKESKSKNKQQALWCQETPSDQPYDTLNKSSDDQNVLKKNIVMENKTEITTDHIGIVLAKNTSKALESDHMQIPAKNLEKGQDLLEIDKLKQRQKVSKVRAPPTAEIEHGKIDYQTVSEINIENFSQAEERTEKVYEKISNELNVKASQDGKSNIKQLFNTEIQGDGSKNKRSKSRKKKHNTPKVETALTSQPYEKPVENIIDETVSESAPDQTAFAFARNFSKVKEEYCKSPVPESDSKNKKCIFACSESVESRDKSKLSGQENGNKNKKSRRKLKNEIEQIKEEIAREDKEIDQSCGIEASKNNWLTNTASSSQFQHDHHNCMTSISNLGNLIPESHNTVAAKDETKSTTIQGVNFFEIPKYDLLKIFEAEKRFAKILESEFNNIKASRNCAIEFEKNEESKIDSSSNNNTKFNCMRLLSHEEDNVENIPEEKCDDMPRRVVDFSSIVTNSCNETLSNNPCTLSWSQVAAKQAKAKSEGLQAHIPQNQPENKQRSEYLKPVCIRVANKSSKADDMSMANADSEGFIKYISKRDMRKQRSRTSSRNDEEVSTENRYDVQIETPITTDEKSTSIERTVDGCDVENSSGSDKRPFKSMEENTAYCLLKTGLWMDKWKYHDAEVKFFESLEKMKKLPLSNMVRAPTDDNDGPSSSGPPLLSRGNRDPDIEPCDELANETESLQVASDLKHEDKPHSKENDIFTAECDSITCHTKTKSSSHQIKHFFIMVLMKLYFMFIYCASGLKKRK